MIMSNTPLQIRTYKVSAQPKYHYDFGIMFIRLFRSLIDKLVHYFIVKFLNLKTMATVIDRETMTTDHHYYEFRDGQFKEVDVSDLSNNIGLLVSQDLTYNLPYGKE